MSPSLKPWLMQALKKSRTSRLIPRRGAGPALRSDGGHEIDEYLMRLLRVGAANEIEAAVYVQVRGASLAA